MIISVCQKLCSFYPRYFFKEKPYVLLEMKSNQLSFFLKRKKNKREHQVTCTKMQIKRKKTNKQMSDLFINTQQWSFLMIDYAHCFYSFVFIIGSPFTLRLSKASLNLYTPSVLITQWILNQMRYFLGYCIAIISITTFNGKRYTKNLIAVLF
jgi:hypothetical protein